jgi:hypothetical protein
MRGFRWGFASLLLFGGVRKDFEKIYRVVGCLNHLSEPLLPIVCVCVGDGFSVSKSTDRDSNSMQCVATFSLYMNLLERSSRKQARQQSHSRVVASSLTREISNWFGYDDERIYLRKLRREQCNTIQYTHVRPMTVPTTVDNNQVHFSISCRDTQEMGFTSFKCTVIVSKL